MEDEFLQWYEENEIRFHQGHLDEKEIAYSAWLEGQKAGQNETLVMRIREKCEDEIKWVKESLDEHAELGNYTEADTHWLPGYRKAFEEILEILKNA